jgi:hypothetical protein
VDPLRRLAALGRAIPLGRLQPDRARLARRLSQRGQDTEEPGSRREQGHRRHHQRLPRRHQPTAGQADRDRPLVRRPHPQKLLAQDAAAAAIAIDPGQIKGVKPLPFAQIRSGLPVLSRPGNKKRAVTLTRKQFRYGFGNALSESESGELFDRYAIPGPGKPLFEASAANFKKASPAAVDTRKKDHGPLLITGGGKDHTVPEVVARAACKLYAGSGAVTDYHAFPDRGHSLVLDHGWREIADYTLSWLASQDL